MSVLSQPPSWKTRSKNLRFCNLKIYVIRKNLIVPSAFESHEFYCTSLVPLAYQDVRNVSFSENFVYVLNEWSPFVIKENSRCNFNAYFPRVSLENYHRTFTCAQRKIVMISAILVSRLCATEIQRFVYFDKLFSQRRIKDPVKHLWLSFFVEIVNEFSYC